MPDRSYKNFTDGIIGIVYAFLFFTSRKRIIGVSLAGLLKNIPWIFGLLAWPFGLGIGWMLTGFIAAILIRLIYWGGKRSGYIHFVADVVQPTDGQGPTLVTDQRVSVLASGIFSVKNWETYVRQQPAEYWQVGMGDHAIMVNHGSGRFLYQFIKQGSLQAVLAGGIFSGRNPLPALEITFLTDWVPEATEIDFLFYSPEKEKQSKIQERKIYLAFDNIVARVPVWNTLNLINIEE